MIELSELQYFRVVANLEHVTKAAQELHVSQPNLSNAISRLESKLGVNLFERTKGKIRLTDIGHEYLNYVNDAFATLEAGERHVREMYDLATRQISFSCSINALMNEITESFLDSRPEITIHQDLLPAEKIREQFEKNEIDFAVTMRKLDSPMLEWTPVFRSPLLVGVSAKHRFSDRKVIDLEDLRNEQIVCNNVGADRYIIEALCAGGGFKPHIHFESTDGQYIGNRLQRDNMLTLLPALDLYFVECENPQMRPVHPIRIRDVDAYVTVGILKRRDRSLNKVALEFLDHTKRLLLAFSESVDAYLDEKYDD